MPGVRKRLELHFDAATNYQNQKGGGGNASIGNSLVPTWPHPLNGFAIALCRTLPHCSSSLFLSHLGFLQGAQRKSNLVGGEALQLLQLHPVPTNISSITIQETPYVPQIKSQEARDDKQRGHIASKFCKDPRIGELACHGYQTDVLLS